MTKPTVRVVMTSPLVVGRPGEVTIEVTAAERTKVEYIEVHIEGRQGWEVGSGKSKVAVETELPAHSFRLMGGGELAAATTTPFDVKFPLPRGTAPSHDLAPAHARLVVRVHVSLPWRIDVRHAFELPVRLPPPATVVRTPAVLRSGHAHADAGEPRLEVSLASTVLVAGEELVGSVALFHLDDRRHVDVSLVPLLRLYGRGRPRDRRGAAIRARVELPAGHGGQATPFRIPLPAHLTPGFETVTHALEWQLVVSSDTLFGRELVVRDRLTIVDAAAAAAPLTSAPRVGDDRIAALFARVAGERGWRVDPPVPEDGGRIAISRELDGGLARISYAYRGDDGSCLRTRLEHPTLGLGLTVAPGSLLRHLFWTDVEVGVAAWDRAHQVGARFPEQAVPFLAAVVPTLTAAGALGSLVHWDDDSLAFEQPLSTTAAGELAPMLGVVEQLAGAIAYARRSIAPPPGVSVDAAAWRELATWLDGDLALGDLSLEGTLDGVPAHTTLEWDGRRPLRLRASVGPPAGATDELRKTSLALAQPLADVLAASTPEAIVECVAAWPTYVIDVSLADAVARGALSLAAPAADGPLAIDASRVRALLVSLRSLLAAVARPAS